MAATILPLAHCRDSIQADYGGEIAQQVCAQLPKEGATLEQLEKALHDVCGHPDASEVGTKLNVRTNSTPTIARLCIRVDYGAASSH